MEGVNVTVGYYFLSFCYVAMVVEVTDELKPRGNIYTNRVIFADAFTAIIIYSFVSFFGYLTIYRYDHIDKMENFITYLIDNLGKH